jgi:hypothetical protein
MTPKDPVEKLQEPVGALMPGAAPLSDALNSGGKVGTPAPERLPFRERGDWFAAMWALGGALALFAAGQGLISRHGHLDEDLLRNGLILGATATLIAILCWQWPRRRASLDELIVSDSAFALMRRYGVVAFRERVMGA